MPMTDATFEERATDVQVLDGLSLEDYVRQPHLNRSFTYRSQIAQKDIKASYSIVGSQDPHAPTYLYLGGIFGGRFHGLWADYLAKTKQVKGIFPDRPGLGQFTNFPIEVRVPVLLEAIPRILADAGAKQVCLVALSGGAMYALSLLRERQDLIRIDLPIYLMSPWVPPSKSGVRVHMAMKYVPSIMTRSVGTLASMLLGRLLAATEKEHKGSELSISDSTMQETCGGSRAEIEHHRHHYKRCLFAEATSGSAEDYLLDVKEVDNTGGMSCADYETFVRKLSDRCRTSSTRVTIHTFFAEGDSMIGHQGIKYFDDLFGGSYAQHRFDYTSETVKATDHEGIGYPEIGVVGKIMHVLAERGP